MRNYIIRSQSVPLFALRAYSAEDAATRAAVRLYGHRQQLAVCRTSGERGRGGFFRAQLPSRVRARSGLVPTFHVQLA